VRIVIFIQGEKKEVRIEVTSTQEDPFTIRNAIYELYDAKGGTESNGDAMVSGGEVYAIIEPQCKGEYRLIYTYEIADERLKTAIHITVI